MKHLLIALALLCTTSAHAAQIEVSNKYKTLTFTDDSGQSRTFPVAVGKPGTQFHGSYVIDRKAEWPSWTPTPHMCGKTRCATVPGGPRNPLGARGMYLAGTLYRIHGTNSPKSIGHAASHGCIRMLNSDVTTLYSMVPVGTTVNVK